MSEITLRFYEELNDFLAPHQRKKTIQHDLRRRASVKDLIESFHVPHTEVEIILVNGRSVDFGYLVQGGDHISVYPMFESLDIFPLVRLRPDTLRESRFIADCNLGRLARYLRLLGFDTLYSNHFEDSEIAKISAQSRRIVLTRDRLLLHQKIITHGYFVREVHPRQQAREVLARFDLARLVKPFSRCTRCNGEVVEVDKQAILEQLEPKTIAYYDDFRQCPDCGQVYWPGGHYQRALKLIEQILER